jgi:hypothetical protein
MRLAFPVGITLLAAAVATAQCPPSCVGGGGPATTDCFLSYGDAPGKTITCNDGDPSCDGDGAIDGVCTFGFTACTNVAVGSCPATPLDGAPSAIPKGTGAEAFVSALGGLSTTTSACTEKGLITLSIAPSAVKLKPAKLTLRLTAAAGGKKDKDTFKFVCNPARPGLAANVQPIFTTNCTYAGCHSGALPQSSMSLEAGQAMASLSQKVAYVRHFCDYHYTPHLPTIIPMIVPPTAPRIRIGAKALVMIASGRLSKMPKIRP